MKNNSNSKFVKLLINHLQKFKHLKDSNEVIESTSKKVQNQLNSIKATALTKYNTAIQEFQNISSEPITPVPKTLVNWWQWYQHLTGLNDVEKAKQNVNFVQEKLLKCQEERRNIRVEAMAVNNKIQEIHHELLMISRDNPKYVQLTIMENKNLQHQKMLTEKLNMIEEEEKDYFMYFTTVIKEYHDAQSLNAQKYKYLSILASAFAAIVSLAASMIYNNRKMIDLRNMMVKTQDQIVTTISNKFHSLEEQFNYNSDIKKTKDVETLLQQIQTSTLIKEQGQQNALGKIKDYENYGKINVSVQDTMYNYVKTIGPTVIILTLLKLIGF